MEHEEIFTLMMEALDGELEEARQNQMQTHLQICPSCTREWHALLAIHQLFLQSPVLSPAAGFTQRTLSRLPDTRYRIWAIGSIYAFLLVAGLLPLAIIAWLVTQVGPALNRPAFVRSLFQAGEQVLSLGQAFVGACWRGLADLGELAGQRPAVIGGLLVMIGIVFLWGGIYSQLTRPQRV